MTHTVPSFPRALVDPTLWLSANPPESLLALITCGVASWDVFGKLIAWHNDE